MKFTAKHKEVRSDLSGGRLDGDIDVTKLSTEELYDLRRFFMEQIQIVDEELDRWEPVYCTICDEEDLGYRGVPFITWGIRAEHILCPRHLWKFDNFEATHDGISISK